MSFWPPSDSCRRKRPAVVHWHKRGYGFFGICLNSSKPSRHQQAIPPPRDGGESRSLDSLPDIISAHPGKTSPKTRGTPSPFYMEAGFAKWGRPYLTRSFFSLIRRRAWRGRRRDSASSWPRQRSLDRRAINFPRLRTLFLAALALGAESNITVCCYFESATNQPSMFFDRAPKTVERSAHGESQYRARYLPQPPIPPITRRPRSAPRDFGLSAGMNALM